MNQLVLCVDFDGTITYNDTKFPAIGTLRPYAKKILEIFAEHGHKIIISTCRCGIANIEARLFCCRNKIPFTAWCDNIPERIAEYGGQNPRKISADIYFDDKGFNVGKMCFKTWVNFFVDVIKREDSGVDPQADISIDYKTAIELYNEPDIA